MSVEHPAGERSSPFSSVLMAWVLSVAVDFFLHAGVLAGLYREPSAFLLPAEDAFRRIPLGYIAFLVLIVGLFWLCRRLAVRDWISGLRLGAVAGAVVWGALALGLVSISTAPPTLLAGWWIGQTIELGLAGAVLGAAETPVPRRRLWVVVAAAVIVLVGGTIVLQSLGCAPAMRTNR